MSHVRQLPHRARQQGMVLIIALIVLVMLSLVAIAQFRLVDTNTILAGNLAFRQAALHAVENGVDAASAWLANPNAGIDRIVYLRSDQPGQGYYATTPAIEPDWTDPVNWPGTGVRTLPGEIQGQRVDYVIHRMCAAIGPAMSPNECGASSAGPVQCPGCSKRIGTPVSQGRSQIQYRVTVRVRGARGTAVYGQAMVVL